jgi:adenylate cyclase class 2
MPPSPTPREVEVKLRVGDLKAIIRKLRGLGAAQHGRVLERNTLYDTPGSDIRRRGRLLRLRIESPAPGHGIPGGHRRFILTAKAPVPAASASRYKEKFEREVVVSSSHNWAETFRAIGLRPGFIYEKYRITFRFPGLPLHLDLDETPVGDFLELESPPSAIDRAARALGFAPRDYIRATYWDLYAANCRRRGRAPRNMLFHA